LADLATWQYIALGITFIWSGFVRSGLGFGGAALALPLMLLVLDDPVVLLPLIAIHLLIFAGFTSARNLQNIDWPYLKKSLLIMAIPKIVGVIGLLSLPNEILTPLVFGIIFCYALMYIFSIEFKSNSPVIDTLLLILGGYVSGTSLVGAPLIIAVYMRHVPQEKLRDTLFLLWVILVSIKVIAFILTDTDLQLIHHTWALPCAAIGHWLGLRLHKYLQSADEQQFKKWLGTALLVITSFGLYSQLSRFI